MTDWEEKGREDAREFVNTLEDKIDYLIGYFSELEEVNEE